MRGAEAGAQWALGPHTKIGRGTDADVRIAADGVSRMHAEIDRVEAGYRIRDLGSRNGTLVNGEEIGEALLRDGDKIQLGPALLLRFALHDAVDVQHHDRMREGATRDALTGLHNRRYLVERLAEEVSWAVRHGAPLAVVLADVDRFKSVNDTHGHLAGDAVLVAVADRARRCTRAEDVIARYGGEEIAIVARSTPREGGIRLAERVRAAIEELAVPHERGVLRVTVSAGVAIGPTEDAKTPDSLIAKADRALYAAKLGGRNRVIAAG
jgi:diguanylate cyclase (GGDEF)-like protein